MGKHLRIYTEQQTAGIKNWADKYSANHPAIILIQHGNLVFQNDDNITTLQGHTVLYSRPYDGHQLIRFSKNAVFMIISFERTYVTESDFDFHILGLPRLIQRHRVQVARSPSHVFTQIWNLTQTLNNTLASQDRLYAREFTVSKLLLCIVSFFFDILFADAKNENQNTSRHEKIVVEFLHLLIQNLKKHRQVHFYAESMSLTNGYLSTTIKEATGYSPKEIIDKGIIMEIKRQLRSNKRNIKEIAEHLSFSDQYQLSKFFKKHTLLSPSTFRKNINMQQQILTS